MYGLEEKRNQVLAFINTITEEQAHLKPEENGWSILEVLEHLYLMERFVVYQVNQAIKQGHDQQASQKPIHRTTNRDYKVEAPEPVQPKGAFKTLADAKEGLNKLCEATLFLIHNIERKTLQNRVFPHLAFGEMNVEQWIEFIGWHELRHLDQMKEVKTHLDQ